LWIGGTKNPALASLETEYIQRIQRFVPIENVTVPEAKKVDPRQHASQMDKEAELLRKKIGSNSYLVSLDENGEELTSEGFAGFFEKMMNRGISEITFLGGGYMGIPGVLRDRSEMSLSLSRLTLPHELARVVLLEQIYRSFSIIRGLPYHR
jgi:23S rRNA (pseudouridine1915-N3)-methyltransferase